MTTPQTLLLEAVDSLPEIEAARLRYETADARLAYTLEISAMFRRSKSGQRQIADLTTERRNAWVNLETVTRQAWIMVPHTVDGDTMRVHHICA